MKGLIRLEELLLFLFSIFLFIGLDLRWWWFLALLLAPDIGMFGYGLKHLDSFRHTHLGWIGGS